MYKKAFESVFAHQQNRPPVDEDLSPFKHQQVPFGEWLLSVDPEKVRVLQRCIRKHIMRVKFRELCTLSVSFCFI